MFFNVQINIKDIKDLLPTDEQEKWFKRSIKIYIKTAPACAYVATPPY